MHILVWTEGGRAKKTVKLIYNNEFQLIILETKSMKVLKYFAASALALTLFASCNKNQEPNKENGPKDLVVSLTLGSAPRAAIGDATDKIADQAAASVKAVDMYLVDATNKVIEGKRFENADLTQLMQGSALGKNDANGWKFNDVSSEVSKVITIVNPQGDVKAKDATLLAADLELELKVAADKAVYYNVSALADATEVENYGYNPNNPGRKVIAMNIKAEGLMNRFQVEDVDFVAIKFKDDAAKAEYQEEIGKFVATKMAGGMTKEEAIALFATDPAGMNGSTYTNPTQTVGFGGATKTWNDFFKVVNVSASNTGLFMNRFNDKYTLDFATGKFGMMSSLRKIQKQSEGYTVSDGTLKFATDDRSDVASYYVAGGLKSVLTNNKVAAFNFFAKDDNTTKLVYKKEGCTAPKLHFYFAGSEVSDAKRYINIQGYQDESGSALDDAKMANGAQLLTINIRNAGNNVDGDGDGKPDGPVVDSEDPTLPDNGNPDITDDGKKNLAVHVTVTPWTNNNVKPVF